MPGKSLLFSGQTVSLHSLLKFIMRIYEDPQKNGTALECRILKIFTRGIGLLDTGNKNGRAKKGRRRKGSGNEEKLTLRPA